MGFDSWGSTRVAMPSLPTTDDQQVAQVMAEQRSDSRSLPGGQRSRRSSQTSGSLTVTAYEIAPVDASYTEGVVPVSGLYIVRSRATVAALADTYVVIELGGAGGGDVDVDQRSLYVNADGSGIPIFATGTAWCNEGTTLQSLISNGTVTAHSLTYTLIEAS